MPMAGRFQVSLRVLAFGIVPASALALVFIWRAVQWYQRLDAVGATLVWGMVIVFAPLMIAFGIVYWIAVRGLSQRATFLQRRNARMNRMKRYHSGNGAQCDQDTQ